MPAIWLWLTQNWRVVAVIGLAALAYTYHRYALHAADSAGYERSQNEYLIAQAKADKKALAEIAQIDFKHYMDMEIANARNEKLIADLRSGARVMYARVKTGPASGSASVGHGYTYAQLDGKIAGDLAAIAADGDAAIRQLTAAQEIIRALLGR